MWIYILFFILVVIGVILGYNAGKKQGFDEGWKACWIVFSAHLQKLKQFLYEEGKKSDNTRSSRDHSES